MIRRRILFSGRVQGVGFRAAAREVAREHDITGWVRNEPAGAVCLECQGDPPVIELYLLDLRERMSGFIRGESADDAPLVEGETGFEVRD